MERATARRREDFDVVDLFLADSRLVRVAANEARYRSLRRVFGISRQDANLLTLVLVLTYGSAAAAIAGRVIRWPLRVNRADLVMGGFTAREGIAGMAGPAASSVSPFGTLMTIAVVGGMALPATRRAIRSLKATEHRLRLWRESQYATARSTMEGLRPWDRSSSTRSSPPSTQP